MCELARASELREVCRGGSQRDTMEMRTPSGLHSFPYNPRIIFHKTFVGETNLISLSWHSSPHHLACLYLSQASCSPVSSHQFSHTPKFRRAYGLSVCVPASLCSAVRDAVVHHPVPLPGPRPSFPQLLGLLSPDGTQLCLSPGTASPKAVPHPRKARAVTRL